MKADRGEDLLLDTNVLLWLLGDEISRVPEAVLAEIRAEINAKFVSAASVLEISIKRALGKVQAPADLPAQIRSAGFVEVAITFAHAQEVGELPQIHRDPFDRLIVAQARVEGMTIVTADRGIGRYPVQVLAAN